ncbi:USP6 N-terminal-like protein isoform X1 [Atheta coriaria]|uniref:USP6 N-terminal-like protein isoform X1 n=1 Tax=Dalotia coriaria TaxID=877792 RepID=UPI0031F35F45
MNEEDLIKRAFEEREKIFKRYELGRAEGAEIDPWEDPQFEVYHATDRYGFIHDKRLPAKLDPQEAKKQHIELERTKKWLKMLKFWDTPQVKEKLHKRIYKGIPNSLRPQVWMKLLDVEEVKKRNPGRYMEMCKLARLHSTDARQIDSDVNRQFREHIHYRERYSIKQQSLFNVLTAYAMYNSEVGYCQGMSGLAGVLLMYMAEEEAFWAVHILLTSEKYAMHGLYKEGFPKLTRFLEHHDKILTKFQSKLKKHFDKHGLDAILYSLKWYFVCFVERVPFSLCLRIWDIYLLDGDRIITAMAYTILKLHKRNLLRLNDMDSITQYLQVKLYKDFQYDEDVSIASLEKTLEELKKAKMEHPGPPTKDEIPSRKFGVFVEPTLERKVGIRQEEFTDKEKETSQIVTMRSDAARISVVENENEFEHDADNRESQLSAGTESVGHTESKFSFDVGMDDASSLLDCEHTGSRRSLADTSVTSTADLSVFSAVTRSQAHDNSLDTHSNMSDNSVGGGSSVGSGVGASAQKALSLSTHSTPRATPHQPSPDVLRIYVPYTSPLDTPIASPQNGDVHKSLPYSFPDNRIRIKVDNDELSTPIVEHGHIRPFILDSPELDLK